jgi:hypothetical protein
MTLRNGLEQFLRRLKLLQFFGFQFCWYSFAEVVLFAIYGVENPDDQSRLGADDYLSEWHERIAEDEGCRLHRHDMDPSPYTYNPLVRMTYCQNFVRRWCRNNITRAQSLRFFPHGLEYLSLSQVPTKNLRGV